MTLSHFFGPPGISIVVTSVCVDDATDCISREGIALGRDRLSIRLFSLCLLNQVTFDLFACRPIQVIMTIARQRLKV